jgi:hypothetical protein
MQKYEIFSNRQKNVTALQCYSCCEGIHAPNFIPYIYIYIYIDIDIRIWGWFCENHKIEL